MGIASLAMIQVARCYAPHCRDGSPSDSEFKQLALQLAARVHDLHEALSSLSAEYSHQRRRATKHSDDEPMVRLVDVIHALEVLA